MKTIWKYPVDVGAVISVRMPAGAQVLSVQMQRDIPCIWALVEPDAPVVIRQFVWHGTGHPVGAVGPFVGTVQVGMLVFHLFEAR